MTQAARRRLLVAACIATLCVVAGMVVVVCLTSQLPTVRWAWWGPVALFALMLLSEAGNVEVAQSASGPERGRYMVSLATIPHVASALLLPPAMAAALAGAGMLIDELRRRSPLSRLLFNVACTVFSVGVAALEATYLGIAGDSLGQSDWWRLLAFFLVVATYYVVNTLPVVAITTLASGGSFWRLLSTNARYSLPAEFAVAVIGGLAAHEWVNGPAWMVAGIFPAMICHLALRSISARNRKAEQIASLDRLGRALSAVFSVEEVFEAAAADLRGTDLVAGCFVDLAEPPMHLVAGVAGAASNRRIARDLVTRVRTEGETVWLRGSEPSGSEEGAVGASWLVLPLERGTAAAGCFGIIADRPDAFDDDDRAYFGLVAERIAVALENARRAAELVRMAFHDALTGLPNRALLLDRLDHALALGKRRGHAVAVLFVDLDDFKLVNDSLGHEAGDALLQSVAERLRSAMRPGDTLARFGGDEFVVLVEEPTDPKAALAIADGLGSALRVPIDVSGRPMIIEASIGVALSTPGTHRPSDLLRDADLALYRAKSAGKGCSALFEPALALAASRRLEMGHDLRRAIDRHEFRLYYQPIVDLQNGELAGWEALVRWEHPRQGLVSPIDFIPIAEETGLIVPIGQWVLEEACRQARIWLDQFAPRKLVMSVNLSGRQFQQPSLVDSVTAALGSAALDPHVLKIELTESVVMQDVAAASATLGSLSALGVGIAIDDFGTGYSSLAYLKRFPIETLKIDRSFVNGIVEDAQDFAIVRGVVALAKTLNLKVTAEGIETPGQEMRLRELGCDLGQGYLFGRPQPASSIVDVGSLPGARPVRAAVTLAA